MLYVLILCNNVLGFCSVLNSLSMPGNQCEQLRSFYQEIVDEDAVLDETVYCIPERELT